MVVEGMRNDTYIIHIQGYLFRTHVAKGHVHQATESGGSALESERHYVKFP